MGGISQCPVCGSLYYGDYRDDWQTCACGPPTPPEEVARLRAEYEADMEAWERSQAEQDALNRCSDAYIRCRKTDEDDVCLPAWQECTRQVPEP